MAEKEAEAREAAGRGLNFVEQIWPTILQPARMAGASTPASHPNLTAILT